MLAIFDGVDWRKFFVQAILIGCVTVGLAMLWVTVDRIYRRDPPLDILAIDRPPDRPLCPGMIFDLHNQVTVRQPSVLLFAVSVMDKGENYNINGTQSEYKPRPHPHASIFRQMLPWTVPNLPPGEYKRVLSVRTARGYHEPKFVILPFTIGKDCQ